MKEHRIINGIFIYEENSQIQVEVPNIFNTDKHFVLTKKIPGNLMEIFFYDKLEDLSNYTLNVYSFHYPPRFVMKDGELICRFCKFIEIVQKHLRVNIELKELATFEDLKYGLDNIQKFHFKLKSSFKIYLNLNDLMITANHKTISTYYLEDCCYFIKNPPKIPIYEQILILPLDKTIWLMMAISTGCCAVVWRLYKNHGADDSYWHFIFVVYGYFLGQSLNLRM